MRTAALGAGKGGLTSLYVRACNCTGLTFSPAQGARHLLDLATCARRNAPGHTCRRGAGWQV